MKDVYQVVVGYGADDQSGYYCALCGFPGSESNPLESCELSTDVVHSECLEDFIRSRA